MVWQAQDEYLFPLTTLFQNAALSHSFQMGMYELESDQTNIQLDEGFPEATIVLSRTDSHGSNKVSRDSPRVDSKANRDSNNHRKRRSLPVDRQARVIRIRWPARTRRKMANAVAGEGNRWTIKSRPFLNLNLLNSKSAAKFNNNPPYGGVQPP